MGYFLQKKSLFSQLRNNFSIIKIKTMKLFNTLYVLILGPLTLFSISNANSVGRSYHIARKVEIECISDDEKCIDAKEKELLYKVEV